MRKKEKNKRMLIALYAFLGTIGIVNTTYSYETVNSNDGYKIKNASLISKEFSKTDIKYVENPNKIDIPKSDNNKRIKVAIIDSEFKKYENLLKRRHGNVKIVDKYSTGSVSTHGRTVLYTMANNENFDIIATGIGSPTSSSAVKPTLASYEKIWPEFKNQKVKVVNQSWGANVKDSEYDKLNKYNVANSMTSFYQRGVNDGGLFVFAAGNIGRERVPVYPDWNDYINADINENSSEAFYWGRNPYWGWSAPTRVVDVYYSNPGISASMPRFFPNLEKGWLAVVGVLPKEDEARGKHYAYAGKAKNWTITSDSKIIEPDPVYRGYVSIASGSSFAAPRVSRAATQVFRKYSWMTNSQVRETLLTTTDDLEKIEYESGKNYGIDEKNRYLKPEADDKYGWGYLNPDRALRGPGRFLNVLLSTDPDNKDKTDKKIYFQARIPAGENSYFENNIDGDRGIHKSDKGNLHLLGKNTFSGDSKVSEGELHIYKLHGSDNTRVEEKGKLVLHDNSYVAKLDNTGNVLKNSANVQNKGIVEIDGKALIAGNYVAEEKGNLITTEGSKLTVLGDANLNDTNSIEFKLGDRYLGSEKTEDVIKAKRIITKKAPRVATKGMYSGEAIIKNNGLKITLRRKRAIEYLINSEESSENTAKNIEKVLASLDNKVANGTLTADENNLGLALETLSAESFTTATQFMSGEIYASAQAVTFAQARDVNKTLSNRLSRLEQDIKSPYDWNAWVTSMATSGKLSQSGYATGKTKVAGGQFGLDKKLNSSTQVGVAMMYSHAKADFNKYAGKSKSDGVGISLYGRKNIGNDNYILGKIGGTNIKTNVKREVLDQKLNIVNGNIHHKDLLLSGYVEVGKDFKYLTPFVGYSFDNLKRGSFSESNAAWGIHAPKKNYTTQNLVLGVKGTYETADYKLNGYISHNINVANRDLSFEGNFTGSEVNQKFRGINLTKQSSWAGVGVSKNITPAVEVYGNIDLLVEKSSVKDKVLNIGLKYSF